MKKYNKKILITCLLLIFMVSFTLKNSYSMELDYSSSEIDYVYIDNSYFEVKDFDKEYNFNVYSNIDCYYNIYIEYYDNKDISYKYYYNDYESSLIKIMNNKYIIQGKEINKDNVDNYSIKFYGDSDLIIKINIEYYDNPNYIIDYDLDNKYLLFNNKEYLIEGLEDYNLDGVNYQVIVIYDDSINYDDLDTKYQDMIIDIIDNYIYLRNDLSIIDGNGNIDNPYKIELKVPKEFINLN